MAAAEVWNELGVCRAALPFRFPPAPEPSRLELLLTYWPGQAERTGQVSFEVATREPVRVSEGA